MGTSKGPCCDDCVTTIEYTDDGKKIWSRNFGTDTIDVYSSGDIISVIGNQSLVFEYNDELIVTNGSGNKERYVLPFTTTVENDTIFGQYNINGNSSYTGFDYALDTHKRYSYKDSSKLSQYSYPFEQYTNSANTKNFRTFHYTSGIFNVSSDKIFGYYVNPSSNRFENKNIGFIGAEYRIPSISGDLIYLGFNKYCHAVLEFPSKFEFTSGSPNQNYDELVNIIFNYNNNHIINRKIISGIYNDVTINNYSGNLINFNFNYTDDSFINNQINFIVKKTSGVQPEAYIQLYGTGCNPKLLLPTSVTDIYRGTGLIEYNQFMSYYHYDNDYSGLETCTMSLENIFKAWKVIGYNVNDNDGKIVVNLQRYHNNQDSGSSYFRYDKSVANGYNIVPALTGFLPNYASYYSVTGLHTNINYFQIDNITDNANFTHQIKILKDNFSEYDYTVDNFSNGQLFRYGQNVGKWNIENINIESLNKKDDELFTKINYKISFQDKSYDYVKTNGSGQHYGMFFSSFINLYETVIGADSIVLDFNGVLGSYCGIKNLCGNDVKYIHVSTSKTIISSTTTGIDNKISFIGEYDKVGDINVKNISFYGYDTVYSTGPSGWYIVTPFEIQSVNTFAEYYTPKPLSVTTMPIFDACGSGSNVFAYSGYAPYCNAPTFYGMGVGLNIQVPSLSYSTSPSGWPSYLNNRRVVPFGLSKCMQVISNFSGPTSFSINLRSIKQTVGGTTSCTNGPNQICFNSGILISTATPILDVEGWLQPLQWSVSLPTGVLHGCYPITIKPDIYYQGIPALRTNDIYVPFFNQLSAVSYTATNALFYGLFNVANEVITYYPKCLVNSCMSGLEFNYLNNYYNTNYYYLFNAEQNNHGCRRAHINQYYYLTEGKDWPISGQSDGSIGNHWQCLSLDVSIPEGVYYGSGATLKVEGFNNWNYIDPITSIIFNNNISGQVYYSNYKEYSSYGILKDNSINLLSIDLNRYNYDL